MYKSQAPDPHETFTILGNCTNTPADLYIQQQRNTEYPLTKN